MRLATIMVVTMILLFGCASIAAAECASGIGSKSLP